MKRDRKNVSKLLASLIISSFALSGGVTPSSAMEQAQEKVEGQDELREILKNVENWEDKRKIIIKLISMIENLEDYLDTHEALNREEFFKDWKESFLTKEGDTKPGKFGPYMEKYYDGIIKELQFVKAWGVTKRVSALNERLVREGKPRITTKLNHLRCDGDRLYSIKNFLKICLEACSKNLDLDKFLAEFDARKYERINEFLESIPDRQGENDPPEITPEFSKLPLNEKLPPSTRE